MMDANHQHQTVSDVARFDPSRVERTPEGYLRIPATVARTGIQWYLMRDGKLDPGGEPTPVLRHPDDVFDPEAMASFGGKPVTISHPRDPVSPANIRDLSVGVSTFDVEGIRPRDDVQTHRVGYVRTVLQVHDARGLQAVADGAREMSCGYSCAFVPETGTWGGQPYAYRQREIRGNHHALLPPGERARAGERARLEGLDSAGTVSLTIIDSAPGEGQEGDMPTETLSLTHDNETIQLPPGTHEVVRRWTSDARAKVAAMDADMKGMAGKLAAAEKARDELQAKLDMMQAKAKKAKDAMGEEGAPEAAKDAQDPAAAAKLIQDAVNERLVLLRQADALLAGTDVKLTADMAPRAIRLAVIKAAAPERKVDDRSDDYIRAAYEFLTQDGTAPVATADKVDNATTPAPVTPAPTGVPGLQATADSAYAAYLRSLSGEPEPAPAATPAGA